MKLYATTTSERASKGQGGNNYLRITLTVGNAKEQTNAGIIELLEISPAKFAINYHLNGKTKLLQEINTKGTVFEPKENSKQKCDCNLNYGNKQLEGIHDLNCRTRQKGNKQKGENVEKNYTCQKCRKTNFYFGRKPKYCKYCNFNRY